MFCAGVLGARGRAGARRRDARTAVWHTLHTTMPAPSYLTNYLRQSGLLQWDRDALSSCELDQEVCRLLHTVAVLEDDTALSARQARSLGIDRSPDIAAFLPVWEREEAEHARALRFVLSGQSYDIPPSPPKKNALRRRCIALLPTTGLHHLPPTELVYCALGAAGEYATIVSYTELAKTVDQPAVASLLRSITRQEGRHFAFFLASAQVRAKSMSALSGRVAKQLLDSIWQPVGIPSLGLTAWRTIFARLLTNEDFRVRAEGMDRVVDMIPHLGGLNLMSTFLREHAPIAGP